MAFWRSPAKPAERSRRIAAPPLLALTLGAVLVSTSCATRPAQQDASREAQQGRYVFIDAGAHFGESYTAFQKSGLYSKYSWELFAIEANPKLIEGLPDAPNLTVMDKAIWVDDGTIDFYMLSDTSGANSVLDTEAKKQTVTVESFDFSSWLEANFSEEDCVLLSLDIEGAEFRVIQKMLDDGTFKYIDRLYVEIHPWLLKEMPLRKAQAEFRWLLSEVHKRGVAVVEDSTEDAMKAGLWLDFLI